MASSEADSRLSQVLTPALEKIIKNGSWRKHSKLAHECKSVLERLNSPDKPPLTPTSPDQSEPDTSSLPGVLHDGGPIEYSLAESEVILSPIINACASASLKISDPALDCTQKLIAYGYLRGEADPTGVPEAKLLSKLIESVCKCHDLGDEAVELLVLKTLLSAATSVSLRIRGDCLLQIARTCYDIYLGSKNVVNQMTAKASLIQMLVIVFRRMEADSSTVPLQPIVVAELMEPVEKADLDGTMTMFVQGFITKIMQATCIIGVVILRCLQLRCHQVARNCSLSAHSPAASSSWSLPSPPSSFSSSPVEAYLFPSIRLLISHPQFFS